jgi:predicted nucleotidyltransferase
MKIESIKLKNFETMNPENILKTLEENRDIILSFGVRQLGVFGSCARREQTETSDLDFLVEFDDPTFDNYFDLKFFLEKLFDSQVDLVIKDTIKPRIRSTILEETVYAGL